MYLLPILFLSLHAVNSKSAGKVVTWTEPNGSTKNHIDVTDTRPIASGLNSPPSQPERSIAKELESSETQYHSPTDQHGIDYQTHSIRSEIKEPEQFGAEASLVPRALGSEREYDPRRSRYDREYNPRDPRFGREYDPRAPRRDREYDEWRSRLDREYNPRRPRPDLEYDPRWPRYEEGPDGRRRPFDSSPSPPTYDTQKNRRSTYSVSGNPSSTLKLPKSSTSPPGASKLKTKVPSPPKTSTTQPPQQPVQPTPQIPPENSSKLEEWKKKCCALCGKQRKGSTVKLFGSLFRRKGKGQPSPANPPGAPHKHHHEPIKIPSKLTRMPCRTLSQKQERDHLIKEFLKEAVAAAATRRRRRRGGAYAGGAYVGEEESSSESDGEGEGGVLEQLANLESAPEVEVNAEVCCCFDCSADISGSCLEGIGEIFKGIAGMFTECCGDCTAEECGTCCSDLLCCLCELSLEMCKDCSVDT